MRFLGWVFFALLAAPASAQVAMPCDWQARADALVEPWEETTATFANGAVRVALLDTAEPAASAFYLLILHPPFEGPAGRMCTVVGLSETLGYAAIMFAELEAGYDPTIGLTFKVPAIIYQPENNFQNSALLSISVNQSTGGVAVSQTLAE